VLVLQILLISHHVATGIFGLSTDSMAFEDSDVSTLELNLLVDEEILLDTALQDVKSKGASRCPGCKSTMMTITGGYLDPIAKKALRPIFSCCLLIREAISALETSHNSLK